MKWILIFTAVVFAVNALGQDTSDKEDVPFNGRIIRDDNPG